MAVTSPFNAREGCWEGGCNGKKCPLSIQHATRSFMDDYFLLIRSSRDGSMNGAHIEEDRLKAIIHE